jgi:hypothetical protein
MTMTQSVAVWCKSQFNAKSIKLRPHCRASAWSSRTAASYAGC